MLTFELFNLAAGPRLGGAWAIRAAERAGVVPLPGGSLLSVPPAAAGYTVGLARHPFTWLQSFYAAGGPAFPGGAAAARLCDLAKQSVSVGAFMRNYLAHAAGDVGRALNVYRAGTVLRMEDFPWAMFELLYALGVSEKEAAAATRHMPPSNPGAYRVLDDMGLKRQVLKAEPAYCEAYEYYLW